MDAWISNLFNSFFTEFWSFKQSNIWEFPEELSLALAMRVAWGKKFKKLKWKKNYILSWGSAVSNLVGAQGGQRMCFETSLSPLSMHLFIVNQAGGTSRGKMYA